MISLSPLYPRKAKRITTGWNTREYLTKQLRNTGKLRRNLRKKLVTSIKNNPKLFYSYVRYKLRTKDAVGPVIDSNGKLVDENV